jgi:hypothetical protein
MQRLILPTVALMAAALAPTAWAAEPQAASDDLDAARAWVTKYTPADWESEYSRLAEPPGFRVESPAELRRMVEHYVHVMRGGRVVCRRSTAGGAPIECVDVLTQPALRGGELPLAKPPALPPRPVTKATTVGHTSKESVCPAGSFPRLVVPLSRLFQFRTLREFFRKWPEPSQTPTGAPAESGHSDESRDRQKQSPLDVRALVDNSTHQYAKVTTFDPNWNIGGGGTFNVWHPNLSGGIFSLSQIWVETTNSQGLQTAEAGWHVFPGHYDGDENIHLFAYYTADKYKTTGCYNYDCSAFVANPSDNSAYLGITPLPASTAGGTQQEVTLEWFRDTATGNWWLRYDGDTWVGYYPPSVYSGFGSLGLTGNNLGIDFGGEVDFTGASNPGVDMGSGEWPCKGYEFAAYIRDLHYWDLAGNWHWLGVLGPSTNNDQHYAIVRNAGGPSAWNEYLFMGGPGPQNISIQSVVVNPTVVIDETTFTLQYSLYNPAGKSGSVLLGASFRPAGSTTYNISSSAYDIPCILQAGLFQCSRPFAFPAGTAPGYYDLEVAIWADENCSGTIDPNDVMIASLEKPSAVQIVPCTYLLVPASANVSPGGGQGSFQVQANFSACSWTASTTYSWIHIGSGSTGSGNGTVSFNVDANSLPSSRSGTITAGGQTFTVNQSAATPPTVTTSAGTNITQTGATLNGTVNPNGASTTGWFQWGTTTSYGNTTASQSLGSGTSGVALSSAVSLQCNTPYHFRAAGQNSGGTVYGNDAGFTTSACPATPPTVATGSASGISATGATLNGTVNPNGASTTGWFQWGTTTSYGNTTASQSLGSGTSGVALSSAVSLQSNTPYHFRAVAQNSGGTTYGGDASFTTSGPLTLTVSKSGSGSGTVTSDPAGINYPATPAASFPYGTSVTLTAGALSGSTFTGWGGEGCSGTGTCAVTMTQARNVTASFAGPGNITASASPNPVNINIASTISATVKDGNGNPVPAGTAVTFSTTYPGFFTGNGASSTISPSTVVTDSSGHTWINFSSDTPGNANITVTSINNSSAIVPLQIVNPNANANVQVSVGYQYGNSTSSTYQVQALVTNQGGTPVPYVYVDFSCQPAASCTLTNSGSQSGSSGIPEQAGADGVATLSLTVTASGSVTVTGSYDGNVGATTFQAQVGGSGSSQIYPTHMFSSGTYGVAFTPNGSTLVASTIGSLTAWSTSDYSQEWSVGPDSGSFGQVSASPDGSYVLAGSGSGVEIHRVSDGGLYCKAAVSDPLTAMLATWTSNSTLASAGIRHVFLHGSTCAAGSSIANLNFDRSGHMDYSPSKGYFAAGARDGYLYVWNTSGSLITKQNIVAGYNAYDAAFSSDGSKLAAVGYVNSAVIKVFNTSSWSATPYTAQNVGNNVYAVTFIDNNTKLALGGVDNSQQNGTIEILNVADGTSFCRAQLSGSAKVWELAWNPSTQELAAGTAGGNVYIFKPLQPPDATSPTISISSPSEGDVTNQSALTTTGRVTDDTSVSSFTINGAAVTLDASGNFSKALTLVEGQNTITYHATDPAGNASDVVRHVTYVVDRTPPVVSNVGVTPAVGGAGTHFVITCTVVDGDTGVGSVTATVRNSGGTTVATLPMSSSGGASYSATVNSTGYAVGAYSVDIIAVDSSPQHNSKTLSGASSFAVAGPQTLTVSKVGTGSGTVTSNLTGINCGSTCSAQFTYGTLVTLTAAKAAGSSFAGWSGEGCSGIGTCQVTMTQARNVTATFVVNPCGQTLSNQTVTTTQTFTSCDTLTLGPAFRVATPGNVTARAGVRVILTNGFSVDSGAAFKAGLDPSLQ